jgi:hypothetical protein
VKNTLILVVSGLLMSGANAGPTAVLERKIDGSAKSGDLVSLTDGKCRYVGSLVRQAVHASTGAALLQMAGADAGRWHITISQKTCDGLSSRVTYRAELPRPPSLAGGGGVPPAPAGYPVGIRFELVPS